MISAAAFVEGGIQDSCDDACSICLEDFCASDPSTVIPTSVYVEKQIRLIWKINLLTYFFISCFFSSSLIASMNFTYTAFSNGWYIISINFSYVCVKIKTSICVYFSQIHLTQVLLLSMSDVLISFNFNLYFEFLLMLKAPLLFLPYSHQAP